MKKICLLLLALSALLVSCSPVEYPDVSYSSVKEGNVREEDPQWAVESGTKSALVSFSPIDGASAYTFAVASERGEKSYFVDAMSFSEGRFSKQIRGLEGNTEYRLTLYPVFNGKKEMNANTYAFTTLDSSQERPEYAPYAYIVKREETSCTVHFDFVSSMVYRIVMREKGHEENVKEYILPSQGFSDSYTLTGLKKDSEYILSIQHGKREGEWGVLKTELAIPVYDLAPNMILSVENGVFSLSSSLGDVFLLKKGDWGFLYKIETPESFTIPLSLLTSGERAEYYAVSKSESVVSNAVSYTSPILPTVEKSATTIRLEWDSAYDVEYHVEVEPVLPNSRRVVPVVSIPEVEVGEEKSSLTLSSLVGSTEYLVSIKAFFPDGAVSGYEEKIYTESFAGTYTWYGLPSDGVRSAFSVRVEEAPTDSAYPYYIYVSSQDPMYDGTEHRIMPLVDEIDLGYVPITSPVKYSSQDKYYMKAYRWNAKKWNTTSMSPSEWKPERTVLDGNSTTSYVYSKAIGMSLSTKTGFSFQEKDGRKILVFSNKGDGPKADFVNVGLFTNKNPSPGLDKYSFVLTYMGE